MSPIGISVGQPPSIERNCEAVEMPRLVTGEEGSKIGHLFRRGCGGTAGVPRAHLTTALTRAELAQGHGATDARGTNGMRPDPIFTKRSSNVLSHPHQSPFR